MAEGRENPIDTFRNELDKTDSKVDARLNDLELRNENADLVRQLDSMLRRPEEARAVFNAIESTARQLNLKKMEVCEALGLPPINHLAYPYELEKEYRVKYQVGGGGRGSTPRFIETTAPGAFIILDNIHTSLDNDYRLGAMSKRPDDAINEWQIRPHPKSGKKMNDDDQFNILRDYYCNKIVYSIGGEVSEPTTVSQAVTNIESRGANPWKVQIAKEENETDRAREERKRKEEKKRRAEEEDKRRGNWGRRRFK